MERSGDVGLPKFETITVGEGAEAKEEDFVFGGMESVDFASGRELRVLSRFQLAHDCPARSHCLRRGEDGSHCECVSLSSLMRRPHGDDQSRFPAWLLRPMQTAPHWK